MGNDAYGPFNCPAQECQRDQGGHDFGDAKRFYLHWVSTHKPRCPRTDCKYSLQDLSKSTESYFLRHWSSHFPELNTARSACGQCGRDFPNANNRDRHATNCVGNAADANRMITEATAHELEPDLSAYLTGHVASAPKRPDLVNGLSYDAGLSQPEEHTSSSAWLDERSFEHTIAVPALSLQPTNLAVDLGCDYTNFEQMLASTPQQSPFPGLAIAQSATKLGQDADTLSSSRKRGIEETTTHTSKRHQSIMNGIGNLSESFTRTDSYTETAELGEVPPAGVSGRTVFGESNMASESMIPESQMRALMNVVVTNGADALMTSATSMTTLPLRPRRQYALLGYCYHRAQPSKSKHVEVHKKFMAVNTFVQSTSCLQASPHDHHTWIRKLTRKRRNVIDATSLLVNDVLVSKKTRYSRVRNHRDNDMIRYQSHYPLPARINPCSTGHRRQLSHL
jgi:hypothetical protein